MKSPYAWQCHVCSTSNAAATSICASCGFSARATGREIEDAKARRQPPPNYAKSELSDDKPSLTELLAPLSTWRKAIAILGMILMGSALLWFYATFSFVEVAASIGLFTAGFVLLCLAYTGIDLPPITSRVQHTPIKGKDVTSARSDA